MLLPCDLIFVLEKNSHVTKWYDICRTVFSSDLGAAHVKIHDGQPSEELTSQGILEYTIMC